MEQMRFSGRVEGRVQGVGFRAFTYKTANQYQLTGWVRNELDGSVQFEAQGAQESLESFKELVKKGPVFSKVKEAQFVETPLLQNEVGFSIRH